jgi:ATP-dependent Lon protease
MTAFNSGAQFAEVPVFPLPHVVLFPGAVLPLHVFEPRYRTMMEVALESDRLICMANIVETAPFDYTGQPKISSVAGLGEIVDHERLPDGRFHLLLMGRCRVNLKELDFRPPFRRACASVLASLGVEPDDTERTVLRTAIAQQVHRVREEHPDFAFDYPDALPTSQLVDLCGQYLIADAHARQQLLETLDVNLRLQRCLAALFDRPAPQRRDIN